MPWSTRMAGRYAWCSPPDRPRTKPSSPALIDGLPPAKALVADRGYDAKAIIDLVATHGGTAHIPTQKDRKIQRHVEPALYRQRSEEHTSELQSLMRISYAVFGWQKKKRTGPRLNCSN